MRDGVDPAAQPGTAKRRPRTLGLRQPVCYGVKRDGMMAQPAMAAFDLDVFRAGTLTLHAALPGDDAIAATEDGRCRHWRRRRHLLHAGPVFDAAATEALVQPPRVAGPR